jgi:hypothetical protein
MAWMKRDDKESRDGGHGPGGADETGRRKYAFAAQALFQN